MAIKEKLRHADGSGVPGNPGDQARSHNRPASSVQPVEAEDPKDSAGDSHEQKKVLNENIESGVAQQHPQAPAGQHATGSFTDPTSLQPANNPPANKPKKNGQR